MIGIATALLSAAVWTGSAQVQVMIWEPGGEHPYTTDFDLEYREEGRVPIVDLKGTVVGYRARLVPRRIALRVHHEVRDTDGRRICAGGGQEVVEDGPEGALVVPVRPDDLAKTLRIAAARAGAYQLILPRAVGSFACGGKRNAGDRWVIIGSALFHPAGDIDAADSDARSLDLGGSRMAGSYQATDAPRGNPVRHDYSVKWDLRRHLDP
jgi:hypothetical protein